MTELLGGEFKRDPIPSSLFKGKFMNQALGRTPQEGRALRKEEKQLKEQAARGSARILKSMINDDTVIHTRTEYGRGERDYVRAYVVRVSSTPQNFWRVKYEIIDISYFIATASNRRMTMHGISVGGGHFNKGLEIAEDCWRIAFGSLIGFSQELNWREIN